jgi:hypothetical protein
MALRVRRGGKEINQSDRTTEQTVAELGLALSDVKSPN